MLRNTIVAAAQTMHPPTLSICQPKWASKVMPPRTTSSATPAKPSSRPTTLRACSDCPFGPSVPKPASHSARLEFSSATSFDGRCFSA